MNTFGVSWHAYETIDIQEVEIPSIDHLPGYFISLTMCSGKMSNGRQEG